MRQTIPQVIREGMLTPDVRLAVWCIHDFCHPKINGPLADGWAGDMPNLIRFLCLTGRIDKRTLVRMRRLLNLLLQHGPALAVARGPLPDAVVYTEPTTGDN